MSHFNLIDEAWIPIRLPDGSRTELGIRDTLFRSKEIAAIEDPSPLVVAALHRFLLALLYRALTGPTNREEARTLFRQGLPDGQIAAYLDKWKERFWLFHEKWPFGQNSLIPADFLEPWNRLTAESNPTKNKVLFDHTNTIVLEERLANECVRWILATMSFSIAGGRGYFPSPSANGVMCIPLGRNLQQTLCYSLVPQNREVLLYDRPLWERDPKPLPLQTQKRVASGLADLYTWQSRMIYLKPTASGRVSSLNLVPGEGCDNPSQESDPMQAYKLDKQNGKSAVQFRSDRGIWRDFPSLLPDSTELAPRTVQNALDLASRNSEYLPESILVLGLRYEPPSANLDFWRMERFELPIAFVKNMDFRKEIHGLLQRAEEAQKSLWLACIRFARDLVSRGPRDPDKKDTQAFVDQMVPIPLYWSILETRFHELLHAYTLEKTESEIRLQWLESIRKALSTAWASHRTSVATGDAWAIRALVRAEEPLQKAFHELTQEITQLKPTPKEEDA
jgi:CRISPR system Cascade subunit CasA